MSKNNALFGSHHGFYQEPLSVKGISEQFRLKNKKLHEWHVNKLKWDIENGKLSEDDFDDKIREIPKFHAHGCRKYFQTMVSRHCGDIRLCAIMEGHASPIKTDPSYIKHAKEFIKVYGVEYEKYETVLLVAEYRKNIVNRYRLITSKQIYRQQKIDDIIYRFLFLLGLL